jgi:hypothetical protein
MRSKILLGFLSALLLTGCPDNDDDDNVGNNKTNFTAFTKLLIATTSDATDPVPVNGKNFVFTDQQNQQAYDDVLSDR